MGDVVPLLSPVNYSQLVTAMDEITDATTEAVVIITLGDVIGVRYVGAVEAPSAFPTLALDGQQMHGLIVGDRHRHRS